MPVCARDARSSRGAQFLTGAESPDAKLIDDFKAKFGIKHDADVAVIFDVRKQQLSNWRHGHRPMPAKVRFRMLHHIGFPGARDIALTLFPQKLYDAQIEKDSRRMRSVLLLSDRRAHD